MKGEEVADDASNLDLLEEETEKLLDLLKNREPGCFSWHMMLHERLESHKEVASQILG